MNPYEAQRIAAAVNVLRPDWPTKSLVTLMERPDLANKPRRDVMVAFAWIACETNTSTPARVLEAGPWWKAAAVETKVQSFTPPKREEQCLDCGRHLDGCLCGGRVQQRQRGDASTGAAACRAAIGSSTREAS